jgi:hypothetical protein
MQAALDSIGNALARNQCMSSQAVPIAFQTKSGGIFTIPPLAIKLS